MPGKATDNSATGCLVLIVPTAFLIAFLFIAWPVLLALVVFSAGWNIWQTYQWQQLSKEINPTFNQLILKNQGCVTPLDLAMTANLSGPIARRYLETKVKEFGARTIDYEDRGKVYYFITVNTLGSIFDESEPPKRDQSESQNEAQSALAEPPTQQQHPSQSLIQIELAKRLDVHSSTVYKRRSDSDFSEWTRSRDPEGIAWAYSPEIKEFYPLETSSEEKS
jgi:hypothetical protein